MIIYEVVVHPQSIIHSMVEYKDASVIAQLRITRYEITYSICIKLSGKKRG